MLIRQFFHIIILFFPCMMMGQLTESHLPIIVINTNGLDIPDEPKVNVDLGIINNDSGVNNIDDPFTDYDGMIGIELRGQSSQGFPKKQFGIELRDEFGEDLDVSILGLPEESDFVLSAPFSDKSLMRNALCYILAGQVMEYAPRVRYCELVLNGEYQGVYVLLEKIKRSKSRLDLAKLKEDDVEGEEVEGGYIVRFDKFSGSEEILWQSPFKPFQGAWQTTNFIAAYPKFNVIQAEQRNYIKDYVTDFERALDDVDFSYQGKHYSDFIDVTSFIDFMLMNELGKNVDGYRISSYMYKDKADVLKMGPVWDFNLAFGNADYCEGGEPIGWEWDFHTLCGNDFFVNHFWWKRFLEDAAFTESMRTRWFDLRENEFSNENICGIIDSLKNRIGEGADRNFEAWPVLGSYIWPNRFVGDTYDEEVEYLKTWIEERIEFIDSNIDQLVYFNESYKGFGIRPNPNAGQFILDLGNLDYNDLQLVIFNSLGHQSNKINLTDYSGESMNLGLSPGMYFYYLSSPKSEIITEIKQFIVVN